MDIRYVSEDPVAMAFDEELANRIRELVLVEPGLTERRMFGGLAFLVKGHMAVSASGRGGLLLRVAPDREAALLAREHVGPFQMRGRAMSGWLRVEPEAVDDAETLREWVALGVEYARALPPKR